MKTLVIYYSYSGKTRAVAEKEAASSGADLLEVKEAKKRGTVNAYVAGSFAAMRKKIAKLSDFNADFSSYEKIIIAAPVWAGAPAPAFNNIIKALPSGKEVEVILTSGSGTSGKSKEYAAHVIKAKGCKMTGFRDIKS